MALAYSEVLFFVDNIDEERTQRAKGEMIASAFCAWLMGAAGKKDFEPWLGALGLTEKKEPLKPEAKAAMIEKANAIAERILKMGMKRKSRTAPIIKKAHRGKKNI
jgi:hypothetical protein